MCTARNCEGPAAAWAAGRGRHGVGAAASVLCARALRRPSLRSAVMTRAWVEGLPWTLPKAWRATAVISASWHSSMGAARSSKAYCMSRAQSLTESTLGQLDLQQALMASKAYWKRMIKFSLVLWLPRKPSRAVAESGCPSARSGAGFSGHVGGVISGGASLSSSWLTRSCASCRADLASTSSRPVVPRTGPDERVWRSRWMMVGGISLKRRRMASSRRRWASGDRPTSSLRAAWSLALKASILARSTL
mmetsp:Transcript_17436/g.54269  ORF Transcript_17436/g.54269 Transcript_17436/m.54269 type:complete len:249 (+) Transcript_17436:384-1130(+)